MTTVQVIVMVAPDHEEGQLATESRLCEQSVTSAQEGTHHDKDDVIKQGFGSYPGGNKALRCATKSRGTTAHISVTHDGGWALAASWEPSSFHSHSF